MGTSLTYTVNNPVQNGTLWYIMVRGVFLAGDDCPRLEFLANFAKKNRQNGMRPIHDIYMGLQAAVERTVGREMRTPTDFDYLAAYIYDSTRVSISAMTLKRFWGYLGEKNIRQPRLATLNALAQLVGYTDWMAYYKQSSAAGDVESDFLKNNALATNSLKKGALVRLMWHPDRLLTIRHEGYEVFTVVESANSKLSVGDTFRCGCIIEGEAMFLSGLIHEGGEQMSYVCGREGGVRFRVLD